MYNIFQHEKNLKNKNKKDESLEENEKIKRYVNNIKMIDRYNNRIKNFTYEVRNIINNLR